MSAALRLAFVLCLYMIGTAGAPALASPWGVFDEIAIREWTTDGEPRPRVSQFRWEKKGEVLLARHGFESRRELGADKFADTTQRFVLKANTGLIDVTYLYDDGRPPLTTLIKVAPDGTATESFTDANGVQKRNIYKLPKLSVNIIERQELRDGAWVAIGQTRKFGMTTLEIAEKKERDQRARQLALAQEEARKAEERARKEEMYEREQEERMAERERQASMPNTLQILQGLNQQVQQQRIETQARFDRQMAATAAQVAREQAEVARREAEEKQRRIEEASARQEADRQRQAAQNAASADAADQTQARAQAAQAERASEQKRQAEAEAQRQQAQQKLEQEQERQRREADAAKAAEARRITEQQRLADQKRREEEANRPVAWREGVVLCKQQGPKSWRCDGPLQFDYGDVNDESGLRAVKMACGGGSPNKIGMWSGYMAYGCGYGIHPTDRDYPGNRDIPARYGVGMPPGTRTFYCKRSVNAYCRGG